MCVCAGMSVCVRVFNLKQDAAHNPNAHTYVNGTDVKTHGYAVTHNTCLQ